MARSTDPNYLDTLIKDTAGAIASQAEAIEGDTLIGPRRSAALRILENAKALVAFIDKAEEAEEATI
jgi:hypothetical protein